MNRRLLALCCLVVVVGLAGCSSGADELDSDDLTGDAKYQWETNATVAFNLSSASSGYTTIVDIQNRSELTLYSESAFRGDQSVGIDSLRFRYRNGTVVNATEANITAVKHDDKTVIYPPARNGTIGFTSTRSGKSFSSPVFIDGSYRLDLPESTRVGIPFLSQARPGGYNSTTVDDQQTLRWGNLTSGSISVRYYLVRDLYLFGSLFVIASILGIGGSLYYYRQVRRAKKKRQEFGIDMEEDDDLGDDGPPPGLR